MGLQDDSMVKNPPAIQVTWIQSLGQEDPLKKKMAAHFSILGKSDGPRSLVGYSPWNSKRIRHNLAAKQKTTNHFNI